MFVQPSYGAQQSAAYGYNQQGTQGGAVAQAAQGLAPDQQARVSQIVAQVFAPLHASHPPHCLRHYDFPASPDSQCCYILKHSMACRWGAQAGNRAMGRHHTRASHNHLWQTSTVEAQPNLPMEQRSLLPRLMHPANHMRPSRALRYVLHRCEVHWAMLLK